MRSPLVGPDELHQLGICAVGRGQDAERGELLRPGPWRQVIVLGYGNTIRGDDGIGQRIAEELRGIFDAEQVDVLALPMLSADLILELARTEHVLFIDADRLLSPLTWEVADVVPKITGPSPFSCHVEPNALLYWTQALFDRRPEAKFLHIGARYFEFDEQLSLGMARQLPLLASVAESVIRSWLQIGRDAQARQREAESQPERDALGTTLT